MQHHRPQSLSVFLCTLFIAMVLGCSATAAQEGTGEYIDDTIITAKVKAAVMADSALKATEINVETFKGIVQLSGFVSDPAAIGKAGALARDIKGVKSVKNDLRVK